MRASKLLLATVKETPADAEIISHQLMIRAGLTRKLASGLYSWLPLGVRVLRKIESVIRDELNQAGAQEILMPVTQPAELWQESGRWDQYGPELLRLSDRHGRDFCLGPTHEEIITDLIRNEIRSYKQLPAIFYQLQTKFRDEIRPRFGVMRSREFIMKDAYSFHVDQASLDETYQQMHAVYSRIFNRLGLTFRAVDADSGSIGGSVSHEFHVLADSGEDAITFSSNGNYAANVEQAPAPEISSPTEPGKKQQKVATPGEKSIDEVSHSLNIPPEKIIKTLLVRGSESEAIALLLRGDHELNPIKAEKLPEVFSPLTFIDDDNIKSITGTLSGSLGPTGLNLPIIADLSTLSLCNFTCGANEDGYHLSNVNWNRDLPTPASADLRNIVEGDLAPDGKGTLSIARGIEVGHIFQLGTKYSQAMKATCLNEKGKAATMIMGCYGIGVTRIVAAAIEQNNDERGILWPQALAPFQLALLPMNMHKSQRLRDAATALYTKLVEAGFDVLFDDRKERAGIMFSDMDLIGIPHRIVLGERGLDAGTVEYKSRSESESDDINIGELIPFLEKAISAG